MRGIFFRSEVGISTKAIVGLVITTVAVSVLIPALIKEEEKSPSPPAPSALVYLKKGWYSTT